MVGLYPLAPGLDPTLERLAAGARAALGDAFVGAYLHGSWATGAADRFSDVDFLVLHEGELGPVEEARVQAFHAELFAEGPEPWAQRLDGSYAPLHRFARLDPEARFLYLDNGSSQLIPNRHCNTALTRWLVRERGVALAGPSPRTLVEPVGAAALQGEAREILVRYADWAERDAASFRGWDQAYLVLTLCRVLFTIETGGVASKAQAADWALSELGPEWRPLVSQALADRDDPELLGRHPASAERMEETLAFVGYATGRLAER